METPELDKLQAVKGQSQTIGEFLEWLQATDRAVCEPTAANDHYYLPICEGINVLLAEYFNIDLKKVDQEQKAILDFLRQEQELLETRKLNNDWFFWTHNKYCHFIIFRVPEDRVATGRIREIAFASGSCKHEFQWEVTGPCWSTYEEKGVADTLLLAKQAVNARVMKVIAEEFKEEHHPPLG